MIMMGRFLLMFGLFAGVLLFGSRLVSAGDPVIVFERAYTYPTSPKQKNGAAFLQVTNTGEADVRIVRAETDVAERVELHTHSMDGGIMMMREIEGYDVPAGGVLVLEPTGHHIMLLDLKAPLVEGESFELILHDEDGAQYHVEVTSSFESPAS